jgi:prepilin-type N-terminal cleavage/methylation domain-containing protein
MAFEAKQARRATGTRDRDTSDGTGFTLIEMSIVLVIIGLIVGGVLAGQTLIRAAQLRGIMREKEQFETAVNTFFGKYQCLPGDCSNISDFITGATNGDGNGQVEGANFSGVTESINALAHLQGAGNLLACCSNPGDSTTYSYNGTPSAVPGYNIPQSKYSGAGYLMVNAKTAPSNCDSTTPANENFGPGQCGRNLIIFSGGGTNNSWWQGGGVLPNPQAISCSDVQQLDLKFDDGMPHTGQIQIPGRNTVSCYTGSYPNDTYANVVGSYSPVVFLTNY